VEILYWQCDTGAAGNMLMASLLELHPSPKDFIEKLNSLGIPGVSVIVETGIKNETEGTRISALVHGKDENAENSPLHSHSGMRLRRAKDNAVSSVRTNSHSRSRHSHGHTGMGDIAELIRGLDIPEKVKSDVFAVYRILGEAEASAHGTSVEKVHFHEVGSLGSITDILGICMLIYELAPEKILASPVHVGTGTVLCSHGVLPVPTPATAYILKDIPSYGGEVFGELCTPTGAAILKHFAEDFGEIPEMTVGKIGYGFGKNDHRAANCVKAIFGSVE